MIAAHQQSQFHTHKLCTLNEQSSGSLGKVALLGQLSVGVEGEGKWDGKVTTELQLSSLGTVCVQCCTLRCRS